MGTIGKNENDRVKDLEEMMKDSVRGSAFMLRA